jgi:hypothetical protein
MSVVIQPTAKQLEVVERRFRELEARWVRETGHLSSSMQLRNHAAFEEIIQLGQLVVPLMLRDLQERPRLWVWALPVITGDDPVPPADSGDIAKMTQAWLQWGKAKGYSW